jgi:hypothetical protein
MSDRRTATACTEQFSVKLNLECVFTLHHFVSMSEEEIENAFREFRNELKTCKDQVASLNEDLKILLKHRSIAHRDIVDTAHQLGNRAYDQSDVQRCRAFLEKYHLRS